MDTQSTSFNSTPVQELANYASAFVAELETFNPQLVDFLRTLSFDHVAMKSNDHECYVRQRDFFFRAAHSGWYVVLEERQALTLYMHAPLSVPGFGTTTLVEIIEPRKDQYGKSPAGFEHIEFHVPDQEKLAATLRELGVPFTQFSYRHHHGTLVKINAAGQTIKFMDTPLRDVMAIETQNGEAMALK